MRTARAFVPGWMRTLAFGLCTLACGPEADENAFQLAVSYGCNPACQVENRCTGREFLECVSSCYDEIEHRMPPRPPCDAARLELAECQGTLSCEEFENLQNDESNPCSAEAEEVEVTCE